MMLQLLQMMADLQYANNQYVSALAMYFETAAVKTDYFQVNTKYTIVGFNPAKTAHSLKGSAENIEC